MERGAIVRRTQRLAALLLVVLVGLAGCGERAASQEGQPQGTTGGEASDRHSRIVASMERFQQGRDSWDDQWTEVPASGGQLGFLPEGTAETEPLTQTLLGAMEDRLLYLCGDTAEARAQLDQAAAAEPETAGEAAALFAQSCFLLLQPRAEAVAWQYLWGVAVPQWEAWQRTYAVESDRRPAAFLDAKIEALTPGGVFSRGERTFLVYTLDYILLPEPETSVVVSGGMALREDGWLELGLPNVLAVALREDGSLSPAFSFRADIVPESQKHFPDEFGLRLTYAEDGVSDWDWELEEAEAARSAALRDGETLP